MKRYTGTGIEVTYDAGRCLHAAECVRGLPAVFDTSRRPWINPEAASAEAIAETVRRCPTGALHYQLDGGDAEAPVQPTRVTVTPDGPILIAGDLLINGQAETRAALCRCQSTANAPYCDHSGSCASWHYDEAPRG